MSRIPPAVALLVASLVILGVSFLRPAGPSPTEPVQPASSRSAATQGALVDEPTPAPAPTPGPNASAADGGGANATPSGATPGDPNATSPPPANSSTNGAGARDTANDTTKAAAGSPAPARKTVNQSVWWNATLGSAAAACVPAFGLPVCAPDPSASSAPASRAKALGAAGADVARGALDVSWNTQNGFGGVRATLVAGSGCDGDACATTRDLNVTAASASSPLRLAVDAPLDLASNETLLLVLAPDCDTSGFGAGTCDASSTSVSVRGWVVRIIPADA